MTRSRRKIRIDPRLVIGLILVAASVAGVVGLVSTVDATTEVLTAGRALAPGDRVRPEDLVVLDVRLGGAAGHYLAPSDVPPEGVIVVRSVGRGELVPLDAVGSADGVRLASLVLDVEGALAASVQPGSVVDVWAARERDGGGFGPPTVIVGGAIVVRLVASESIVVGGETTAVELLVPTSRVARVLEAMANSDVMSIVPAAIPVR